jgi:hypothetical protein
MTMTTPAVNPPPEERATGKPFFIRALDTMQKAAQQAATDHPEIRSVIVVLDYHDRLNDAKLPQVLWIEDGAPAHSPAALVGSMQCMLRMLLAGLARTDEVVHSMAASALAVATELKEATHERNADAG